MESCIKCQREQKKVSKYKINKEIQAFLKEPGKYRIIYNPQTGFYKFELIE